MKQSGGEIQPGTRKHVSAASFPGTPAASSMPEWYPGLLASVTGQVNTGRSKATAAANQELLAVYSAIGRDILDRQKLRGLGNQDHDPALGGRQVQFPGATGFSPRNLKYMRRSPKPGPTSQFCKRRLHNCPGTTTLP